MLDFEKDLEWLIDQLDFMPEDREARKAAIIGVLGLILCS